jgi:hypothetical protein
MRIALDALPDGVEAQVDGKRAAVTYGDPEAPTVVVVATDGTDLILFPDRSYKQEDLAKALGLKS